MKKHIFTLTALLLAHGVEATIHEKHLASKQGSTVATVGDDNVCDFRTGTTKIQDALDSINAYTEIRVANNQTYLENINIENRSVIIRGGFADCDDAAANIQNINSRTILEGSVQKAVVKIASDDTTLRIVSIENFEFTNGGGQDGELEVGGIGAFDINLSLYLNRVDVVGNDSDFAGGGLNIFNSGATSSRLYATDVKIQGNQGSRGGGIYCSGINNEITIEGSSSIYLNAATNGGGVYLENGCEFNMYSGVDPGNSITIFDGIVENQADENGGGLFISSGAQANFNSNQRCINYAFGSCLTFAGNQASTTNISYNAANIRGGGIYMTGNGSTVTMDTGEINSNSAVNEGGGIYANDGARFDMFWQADDADYLYQTCAIPGRCSVLYGNSADYGGAVYLATGAQASLLRTHVSNNHGIDNGSVAYVRDEGSILKIEGSVVAQNGSGNSNYVISTYNGHNSTVALQVQNTTFADNQSTNQLLGNTNSAINISSSIISEPNISSIYDGDNSSATFDCVVVNENNSLQGTTMFDVVVDDPEFVDRLSGDYHVDPFNSPAVDLCDASTSSGQFDIDLENRGFDDNDTSDINGPYDAGADETYGSDIIFKNGFE